MSDLVALFAEDDVDRFNPPDHKELLDYASVHVPQMSKVSEHQLSELGDRVESSALLGTIYCRDESKAREAAQRIQAAYEVGDQPPMELPPLMREVINE